MNELQNNELGTRGTVSLFKIVWMEHTRTGQIKNEEYIAMRGGWSCINTFTKVRKKNRILLSIEFISPVQIVGNDEQFPFVSLYSKSPETRVDQR